MNVMNVASPNLEISVMNAMYNKYGDESYEDHPWMILNLIHEHNQMEY